MTRTVTRLFALALTGCLAACSSSSEPVSTAGTAGTGLGGTGGNGTGGTSATGGIGGTGGTTATGGTAGDGGTGATGGIGGVGGMGGDAGAAGGGGSVACPDDGTGWDLAWQQLECETIHEVNVRRSQGATCGTDVIPPLAPLSSDPFLTQAAREHVQDMAENGWFAHNAPNGPTWNERIATSGYQGSGVAAEIASGDLPPAGLVDMIITVAPLDCMNIMNQSATNIGVGYFEGALGQTHPYWVLYFGAH